MKCKCYQDNRSDMEIASKCIIIEDYIRSFGFTNLDVIGEDSSVNLLDALEIIKSMCDAETNRGGARYVIRQCPEYLSGRRVIEGDPRKVKISESSEIGYSTRVISAQDAKSSALTDGGRAQMKEIARGIHSRISSGQLSYEVDGFLTPANQEALKSLGYKIGSDSGNSVIYWM